MIAPERFIVQSEHREEWIAARSTRVTATEVAEASTPGGFENVIANRGLSVDVNEMMQFGTDSEHSLMMWAKDQFGTLPNSWLIEGDDPQHGATPDGLSVDHVGIAEGKTTGKDWVVPPIKYRRQIQWQLHVTGAEWCELVWNLRVIVNNEYRLGWFEPKHLRIVRDEKMIGELVMTAGMLLDRRQQ